jgi:hypothetical protein
MADRKTNYRKGLKCPFTLLYPMPLSTSNQTTKVEQLDFSISFEAILFIQRWNEVSDSCKGRLLKGANN